MQNLKNFNASKLKSNQADWFDFLEKFSKLLCVKSYKYFMKNKN